MSCVFVRSILSISWPLFLSTYISISEFIIHLSRVCSYWLRQASCSDTECLARFRYFFTGHIRCFMFNLTCSKTTSTHVYNMPSNSICGLLERLRKYHRDVINHDRWPKKFKRGRNYFFFVWMNIVVFYIECWGNLSSVLSVKWCY